MYRRFVLWLIAFQLLLVCSLGSSFAALNTINLVSTTATERYQRTRPATKSLPTSIRASTPGILHLHRAELLLRGGSSSSNNNNNNNNNGNEGGVEQTPSASSTTGGSGSNSQSQPQHTEAELVLEFSPPGWKRDPRLGPKQTKPGFLRSTFPNVAWHKLPNWLTYVRCLAIPAMVVLFYTKESHVPTSLLFAGASFTDWLDGYLARRWDITSAFGAFLDPVADKLMVSTGLILLAGRYGAITAVPTAIILAREIAVSALREWMASKGLRETVKVGFQGKLKTALTMATLTMLLLVPESGTGMLGKLLMPSLVCLYLSAGITITSGSVYFKAAAPELMK